MAYSLKEINFRTVSDPKGLIEEGDEQYLRKVEKAADMIVENRKKSPIVLLSGPSGSGKTTTSMKIAEALKKRGVGTHYVAMDDYFKTIDPATAPRTPEGDLDLESPYCMDMELLNRHFTMLSEGKRIFVPKYEFSRRMRVQEPSKSIKLGSDEVVIFEGIHALNDIIVGKNPHAFKLYIAARSNLVDEDGTVVFQHAWLRLCRRIVRDHLFRGSDAAFTLKMWPNVHRGERLYISPYKESADIMFDSCLPFEFSVLKPIVTPLLEALPAGKFPEADAMLAAFRKIEPMDEAYVAPESLAREFIGGSTYDNH